ncbi:MAG: hypothetical protein KGJ13_00810 [Patescibacteria group bacterium]|nr:hypothetical protein [Patescibacteria group bacterium]
MAEQFSFDFEKGEEKKNTPTEEPHEYRFENEDECQYCGAPFESERSCKYCASNPTKKAFLKKQKN